MFKSSLILLALSLTTLSLPTADEGLQKRVAEGWIASFHLSDTTCKTQVGPRPKWDNACLDFTPTAPALRIGGSWGAGLGVALNSFSAWTEPDCQGEEVFIQNRTKGDAGFCQVLENSYRWQEWKSILKYAIEDQYAGN